MNKTSKQSALNFSIILLGLAIISFGLRLYFLDNLRWTYDESIHVLLAQMLARGYTPYSELFISYPPLYILSIDWTWQLFGTVASLQILMSLYTMAGLLGVGFIAWRLGGLWAGIFAPIFLSLEPEFFRGSRAVLTEVPSVSVAALAAAFAAFYLGSDNIRTSRLWLIASGATQAISLMLKILTPYMFGLVASMILVRQFQQTCPERSRKVGRSYNWPQIVRSALIEGVIWGLALILPLVLLTIMFDVPALLDQAIMFRFASRSVYDGEVNNLLFMLSFLRESWVITVLAVAGLWVLMRQYFRQGWYVLVWLLLAVMFALIQVPLRDKHLPLLLPPLSILAGLGVAWLVQLVQVKNRQVQYIGVLSALVLITLLALYTWQTAQVFAGYNSYRTQYLNDSEQILVEFIKRFTAPGDCLITDDPTLAFVTNRPVPPNLAETSSARLRSGYLTEEMLIDTATQFDCPIMAPLARRFKRSAPEFVEWSKANYLGLWLYNNETEILLAKPVLHSQPTHYVRAHFEDQVELVGYDLVPTRDDSTYLSLYWHTLKLFEQDYIVFVHVRDEQNNTLLNMDHEPYNGLVPTHRWPVGSVIKETIRLEGVTEIPPGVYKIHMGMYLRDGLVRLPLVADTSGENAVVIPDFVIP